MKEEVKREVNVINVVGDSLNQVLKGVIGDRRRVAGVRRRAVVIVSVEELFDGGFHVHDLADGDWQMKDQKAYGQHEQRLGLVAVDSFPH